jgi:hypothetical protein
LLQSEPTTALGRCTCKILGAIERQDTWAANFLRSVWTGAAAPHCSEFELLTLVGNSLALVGPVTDDIRVRASHAV